MRRLSGYRQHVSDDDNRDLSSGEAARYLRVSRDTVTRIPRDRLNYEMTPGGQRRYRREDVERYAEEYLGRAVR